MGGGPPLVPSGVSGSRWYYTAGESGSFLSKYTPINGKGKAPFSDGLKSHMLDKHPQGPDYV